MYEFVVSGNASSNAVKRSGRATPKLHAEINVLPAKTLRLAKPSVTAFIFKANHWTVAWPVLIGQGYKDEVAIYPLLAENTYMFGRTSHGHFQHV